MMKRQQVLLLMEWQREIFHSGYFILTATGSIRTLHREPTSSGKEGLEHGYFVMRKDRKGPRQLPDYEYADAGGCNSDRA